MSKSFQENITNNNQLIQLTIVQNAIAYLHVSFKFPSTSGNNIYNDIFFKQIISVTVVGLLVICGSSSSSSSSIRSSSSSSSLSHQIFPLNCGSQDKAFTG